MSTRKRPANSRGADEQVKRRKTNEEIIGLLPPWSSKVRFVKGKGICNADDGKLVQYVVLGKINQNWLNEVNQAYKTRTLVVEGDHVHKFVNFLHKLVPEMRLPDIPDIVSAKCKTTDKLSILSEDKEDMGAEHLLREDRVMIVVEARHWVMRKTGEEGFKFQLLCVRSLPSDEIEQSVVYEGPDI
jgi:hypothetical protein